MRRKRLALGTTHRRLKYEQRIRIWLTVLALPTILCTALLVYKQSSSVAMALVTILGLTIAWAIVAVYFFEQLTRPLQTLANVVSALREDDFSFRARGPRRGDSLGDLALEINALALTLQGQRTAAYDALTLVERVMTSMQSPVLAFDDAGYLRLLNPAAEATLHLKREHALGRSAADLDLTTLLHAEDKGLYSNLNPESGTAPASIRWSVRRTTFRLQGVPHTLLVLTDIAAGARWCLKAHGGARRGAQSLSAGLSAAHPVACTAASAALAGPAARTGCTS